MKKFTLTLSIILLTFIYGNNNPKVALVLSGGGAKGIAQIPALELIDSLNIPIDFIVGTSMGSITGAMYAMGYSTDEIKKIAFDTNWDLMFSNNKERKKLYFFQKKDYDKYRASFKLEGISPQPPIALTNGHNSYMNLNQAVGIYETINNFDDLYIPFRCNAVDLLSGNEIIFKNGSLSKALRASSSIPSVFSPIIDNKLLLVDGGVINNFPADIANKLGADIIIGVNVALSKKNMSDINNFFDVLSQSILLNGFKKRLDNLYYTDVLIEPDLLKKSTLDFDYDSMQELYRSGYKAAHDKLDDLIKIKESLNTNHPISINLSYIKEDSFIIEDVVINSKDNILFSDIFNNQQLPLTITKNDFLNRLYLLRHSNKYININYKIFEGIKGYILDITIDNAPLKTINKIFVTGNKKLSKEFIKDILNIKSGDTLDLDQIRDNIESAYNLDYFESIRYEIEYDEDKTNVIFIIKESTYNKLKLSGSWHNYYKMVGELKLDLMDIPFDKFRLTDEMRIGNNIKENHINIYYINNFSFQSKIIPLIKVSNIKKEVLLYDQNNNLSEQNIYSRDYSINTITPLKHFGYIDIGYHHQKITYDYDFDNERIHYYSAEIDIDQIDNFLYPKEGYHYNILIEKSNDDYNYNLSYLHFDHFIPLTTTSRIKFYGDAFFSNLSDYETNTLVSKSVHYIPFDRTLSFSEYNLTTTDLTSCGLELNFDYKNSTTIRFLYNYIDNAKFKHDAQRISRYSSYGFGFRLKSILGPINLMWTQTEDELYNHSTDNYFFSLGIDY